MHLGQRIVSLRYPDLRPQPRVRVDFEQNLDFSFGRKRGGYGVRLLQCQSSR